MDIGKFQVNLLNQLNKIKMEYSEAKKWYLKGFEDAELTERQPIPIEQTMRDAETFFDLVWSSHKNQEETKTEQK